MLGGYDAVFEVCYVGELLGWCCFDVFVSIVVHFFDLSYCIFVIYVDLSFVIYFVGNFAVCILDLFLLI